MSSSASQNNCAVTVITTGGTIASLRGDTGAVAPALSGQELVPSVSVPSDICITVKELVCLDSSAMTLADIDLILDAVDEAFEEGAEGVVITHGTDSLEETAMAVDTFLTPGRRVILTGAMRPADDPYPDGPSNLSDAILAAAGHTSHEVGSTAGDGNNAGALSIVPTVPDGAYIAFGGHLIPAWGAYKVSTESLEGFAFQQPCQDSARQVTSSRPALPRVPLAHTDVRIVAAWPGAPRSILDDAVADGAEGIVVEAMGSGNVGGQLAEGIGEALRHGIPVVISTRVPRGPVSGTYGSPGGGATLLARGALGSGYLRSPQARILLAAALACGVKPQDVFARVL